MITLLHINTVVLVINFIYSSPDLNWAKVNLNSLNDYSKFEFQIKRYVNIFPKWILINAYFFCCIWRIFNFGMSSLDKSVVYKS